MWNEHNFESLLARLPLPARDLSVYGKDLIKDGLVTPQGTCALAALVGTLVCTLSYKLSRFYTPLYFKGYTKLSRTDQRDWDTRVANVAFAIYISATAAYWLCVDDFFYKESNVMTMLRNNHGTFTAMGLAVGFFVVDLITTLKYWMGGAPMVLHHIGSLTSVLAGALTGEGHQLTLWMLSTEFTTPFISARFLLDKAGLKHTKWYLANGLLIVISWTFARLLSFPIFYYVAWHQRDQMPHINWFSKLLLVVFPAVLALLNTFWYVKIVKGAAKAFGLIKPKTVKAE